MSTKKRKGDSRTAARARKPQTTAAARSASMGGGASWWVRLFYIVGLALMIGGVGIGALIAVLDTGGGTSTPDDTVTEEPPLVNIDPSKTYTATLKTDKGDIVIKLRPDLAPVHVDSFVKLARDGFYNGVTFHRVIPGFVAQTGDPKGDGTGGPGYTIAAEFTNTLFEAGTVGMARSQDPNSAGSQFFITYERAPHLDNQYTVFGEVTSGMEVARQLTPRDTSRNPNLPPGDKLVSVEITES